MRINPGKMRHAIELQECVISQDTLGNQREKWQTREVLRAAVNSLYGQEYWAAAAQGQQNTVVFAVRWCPVIEQALVDGDLTRWRVLFEGACYDIQSVDSMEFCRQLCKIRAVKR